MPDSSDRCPSAPEGESHRWRIPDQGTAGPSRCRYCGAERTFPLHPEGSHWDTRSERRTQSSEADG